MGVKAREVKLGSTGIVSVQNAFGALPIQRTDTVTAVKLLRRALEGGMRFYDTARAYSDSEEKLGRAFGDLRGEVILATKTGAKTPEEFRGQLDRSLKMLRTDHIDLYQFHFAGVCYRPGDGTGMYECMQEAKKQGKILHIGITAHKLGIAEECVESGLYETVQYPLSYLSTEREIALTRRCAEKNVGFLAMKGLAGGLITNSAAAFAFMSQLPNVLPIWGIQRERELEEWLSYMDDAPQMTDGIKAYIDRERAELAGEFCRGCGYCLPCPAGIKINSCARMSLFLRRCPPEDWLTPANQEMMKQIEGCLDCGQCRQKCPYELNTPELLKKNYEDYKKVLSGEVDVKK